MNKIVVLALCHKAFQLLLLLVVFAVPVALLPRVSTFNPAVHSKELVLRFLLPLGLVVGLIALPARWRSGWSVAELLLAAFVAVLLVASAAAPEPLYSFSQTWHLTLLAVSALALSRFNVSTKFCHKLLLVTAATALFVAAYGFLVYFELDILRSLYPFQYREEGRNFVHSFLGNPEYFGGYIAAIAAVSFVFCLRRDARLLNRAAWAVAVFVFLVGLVLSGTRGAFIGFFAAAGAAVLAEYPRMGRIARRRFVVLILLALVAFAAVVTLFSTPNPLNRRNMRLAQRFGDLFNLQSASVRERIIFSTISARMIAEQPVLGGGPGTYGVRFYPAVESVVREDKGAASVLMAEELKSRVAEHAHNDYLEVWAETGSIGLAVLLALIAAIVGSFVRGSNLWRELPASAQHVMFYRDVAFAGILCLLVNALFSFPFHLPARATVLWILVGVYLVLDKRLRSYGRKPVEVGASESIPAL